MSRDRLETMVDRGMTVAQIAEALGVTPRTAVLRLREQGLRTQRQRRAEVVGERATRICSRHGTTEFAHRAEGGWRCLKCRSEAVTRRRQRLKAMLVAEAGGGCAVCGYDRCLAALEFHHADPATKRYSVAARGVTRSLAEARREAKKCVLLCSNCHAEVEAGLCPPGRLVRAVASDPRS